MKKVYITLKSLFHGRSKQERVIDFVKDKKNIEKAVEGSMDKRLDLFHKAELRKHL